MPFRNRLLLLTIILTLGLAYAAAAPASQAGQDIRITNGPVIEEATSNAAVLAWSTDVPSSSLLQQITTCAPALTNSRAHPLPMPLLPPVMITTLSE